MIGIVAARAELISVFESPTIMARDGDPETALTVSMIGPGSAFFVSNVTLPEMAENNFVRCIASRTLPATRLIVLSLDNGCDRQYL